MVKILRNYSLIIIAILSVVIVGCSGSSGLMATNKGTSDYNPHTGNQGLDIRFVKDNPPTTLYDTKQTDVFPLLVEIWNKGAEELGGASGKEGYLVMEGYDDKILPEVAKWREIQPLKGKSAYNSLGGYKVMDMGCTHSGGCQTPTATLQLSPEMSEYPLTLQATACYQYRTEASPTVCIDGNPYTGVDEKPCRVGEITGTGSQGAPVAVSSIEEIAMPGSVQFRIHVSNVGGGKVVDEQAVRTPSSGYTDHICPNGLGFEDLDKLTYSVSLSGSTLQECEPKSGDFRLTDGRGVIFCTFTVDSPETYTTPLSVTLDYGYMESIRQNIVIRNLQS